MSSASKQCARCGQPQGDTLRGTLCAVCRLEDLMVSGVERPAPPESHSLEEDSPQVQRLGPYELLEEVGRGGMGVIYRARHPGLDRIVALKMLLAGEFADAKARERLLREAKIAARLTHPGIVTIHDVGEHDGRPYFAMEYVPGPNLAQLCRDNLLPLPVVVRYVEHLARAVHYAHQHGVIHRDLKPANVLISSDDVPKLTDFGLTKSLIDPTRTLESAGSPNFMAPEQADSSLGATGTPTDIYGLGAILYYLLTGRPPAVGETLSETLRNVVAGDPVPPRELRPALPRDLETVTLRCLEKDPGRRYGSALELAEELARWQRHEPIQARPATSAERFGKWVRRHPAIAALSGALTLALLVGGSGVVWQWRQATTAAREAQFNNYVLEMSLASQAAKAGAWDDVRGFLDRTEPRPGRPDFRGWEWRYLWQASRPENTSVLGPGSSRMGSSTALPDGRTIAVGKWDGGFSLWDVPTRSLVYEHPVNGKAVLPDGRQVICRVAAIPGATWLAFTEYQQAETSFVHLWDTQTWRLIRSLPLTGIPRNLSVSPDGRRLAVSLVQQESRALVFELPSGTLLQTFPGDFCYWWGGGNSLAFTPDSRAVTVEGPPGLLRLMDLESGRELRRFPQGQDAVYSAAISPNGQWLATSAMKATNEVILWDLASGNPVHRLGVNGPMALTFDAASRRLLTGLYVWSVPDLKLIRYLAGEDDWTHTATLLADGRTYLSEAGPILLQWDLDSEPQHRGGRTLDLKVKDLAALPGDRGILVVTPEGHVFQARPPHFDNELIPALGQDCLQVEALPSQNQIAVLRQDGRITLHELDRFHEQGQIKSPFGPASSLNWVDSVERLVLGSSSNQIQIWDLRQPGSEWNLPLQTQSGIGTISEWEGIFYEVQGRRLIGHDLRNRRVMERQLDQTTTQLKFSPRGNLAFSMSDEGKRLLDPVTLKTRAVLTAPKYHGFAAFFPTEPRFVISSGRWGVWILEEETQRPVLELKPAVPLDNLGNVLISPDGQLIAQFSLKSGVVTVWWAPSWQQIDPR